MKYSLSFLLVFVVVSAFGKYATEFNNYRPLRANRSMVANAKIEKTTPKRAQLMAMDGRSLPSFLTSETQTNGVDSRKRILSNGSAEVSVSRPGGVYYGGFLAYYAGGYWPYPLLTLPSYTDLTFSVNKDPDAEGALYWLGVQYWDEQAQDFDYYENLEGEDITTSFVPSFDYYESPMATVTYKNKETESYLINSCTYDKVEYDAVLSTGIGTISDYYAIMYNEDYGDQTLGNYDANWDGGVSYANDYFETNTGLSGMNSMYYDYGMSNFQMTSIVDLYEPPADGIYIVGASINAILNSVSCGKVYVQIQKWGYDDEGYFYFGDPIGFGYTSGITESYDEWSVIYIDEMRDPNGNIVEGVTVEPGQPFALIFYVDDTSTKLSPIFSLHSEYLGSNEGHAYAVYSYEYEGSEYEDLVNCNYVWSYGNETYYQTSWCTGFVSITNYIYLEKDYVNIDYNGGSEVISGESFYAPEEGYMNVTLKDGSDLPSWLHVTYEYDTDESGNYSGEMYFNITADANSEKQQREAIIKVQEFGATRYITVTQSSDPAGIVEVRQNNTPTTTKIYNITGQRVNRNYQGIVIKDGKKFIKD